MEAVGLLVASAALGAAGSVLQKQRVASRTPEVPLGTILRRSGAFFGLLLRDPGWLLGAVFGLAGAITGLQALAWLDLSVTKALGRLETVFVILLGVAILGERIRTTEVVGIALLLAGATLLTAHGVPASAGRASRETHAALAAGVAGFVAVAGFLARSGTRIRPELALAAAAGTLFGMADVLTKGATRIVSASSANGGFSVASPSSMMALLTTFEFAPALVGYIVGVVLVQAAFSVGRVSVIGPVTAIGSLLLPIAFGILALGENANGPRLGGTAVILLGSLVLTRSGGLSPESRPDAPRLDAARSGGR